jgi:hypothetical protein
LGRSGFRISCAAWPSALRISASSSRAPCAASHRLVKRRPSTFIRRRARDERSSARDEASLGLRVRAIRSGGSMRRQVRSGGSSGADLGPREHEFCRAAGQDVLLLRPRRRRSRQHVGSQPPRVHSTPGRRSRSCRRWLDEAVGELGYYRGTYSSASKRGATLTLAGVKARHLALLAVTCPGAERSESSRAERS